MFRLAEAHSRAALLAAAGAFWLAMPLAAWAGWVACPACGGSGKIQGPLVGPSSGRIQSYYGCTRCGGTRGDPINGPPGSPGSGRIWRPDPPSAETPLPREGIDATITSPPPGTPHPRYRNVVYAEHGKLEPAPGYRWLNDRPGDYRVLPVPGTPYGSHRHVVWGEDGHPHPAPGYAWRTSWFWDYRVIGLPGTPHDEYPNVVWSERGRFRPAPGYRWVNDRSGDYRVVPVPVIDDPSVVRVPPPTPEPVPPEIANTPAYKDLQEMVSTLDHARGTLEQRLARVRERRARGEGNRGDLEVDEAQLKQMMSDVENLKAFFTFQMRELAAGREQ